MRSRFRWLPILGVMIGCAGDPAPSARRDAATSVNTGALPRAPGEEVLLPQPEPKAAPGAATKSVPLVLHEWGTFTSVQGSNGFDQPGLHHEEEPLPGFVHKRDPLCDTAKCAGVVVPQGGVTQRMETPVIYFHTPRARDVTVTVGFPQGLISEWYPNAAAFEPPLGPTTAIAGGSMTWKVTLRPGKTAPPPVSAGDIWEPSRHVDSAPLTTGVEDEGFIFYRGLGRFTLPLRVTSTPDGALVVHNDSDQPIPATVLIPDDRGGGDVCTLGAVPAHGSTSGTWLLPTGDQQVYEATVAELLRGALTDTGLREDEAQAMVDTWTISWFHTPGLRLLYVLPEAWTDALLPMTMTPAPTERVRTLVGRVEVLSPAEEASLVEQVGALLAKFGEAGAAAWSVEVTELGRFGEARVRRACELVGSPKLAAFCTQLAQLLSTQP